MFELHDLPGPSGDGACPPLLSRFSLCLYLNLAQKLAEQKGQKTRLTHTQTHAHSRTRMLTKTHHLHTHTHAPARTHTRTHGHTRTHTDTHGHTRGHTHAHARTRTHALAQFFRYPSKRERRFAKRECVCIQCSRYIGLLRVCTWLFVRVFRALLSVYRALLRVYRALLQ